MKRFLALLAMGLLMNLLPFRPAAAAEVLKPTNLKGLNTEADEDDPHLAFNAVQLFFTKKTNDTAEIMFSAWNRRNRAWSPGKVFPGLTGKADYRSVFLTPDGRYPQLLFYATNNDPEKNTKGDNFDIFYLVKQGPQADFTSETAVLKIDTEADEMDPWLTGDGRAMYFSRKDKEAWHVYVASRTGQGGQYGEPARVKLPDGFHHPTLTPDGKTMYVEGPLKNDRWGLFRTTVVGGKWAAPEPLTDLNNTEGATGDRSPNLSRDGSVLFFASDRPGGKGGVDLWSISTAQLSKKKPAASSTP